MSSLADEISKLANPLPVFEDPEDVTDETQAKLLNRHADEDENDDFSQTPSKLRSRAAVLHAEEDTKYSGKRVSRQSLNHDDLSEDSDGDSDIHHIGEDKMEDGEESSEDDDIMESGEDVIKSDEEDEELAGFKETLKFQDTSKNEFSFEDDGDYSKYADDDDGDDDDDDTEEDDDEDDEEDDVESDDDKVDVDEDAGDDGVQKFTKVNVEEEIQKGKAVRTQLNLWDGFLESRIKLQKALQIVNQLPQPDTYDSFMNECGPEYASALSEGESFLYKLLDQLVQLQSTLLLQNQDTRHIETGEPSDGKPTVADDDEEITSESDNDENDKTVQSKPAAQKLTKRKLQSEEYPEFIAKRHQDFKQFRNTTIQKWYDKTRISSGKLAKGFSAFEQSAVKQIEQVLSDKDRLIKRTQLKRTAYRILGTPEIKPIMETVEGPDSSKEQLPRRDHLHDFDAEIFDDDDFYHQQLRELIETKTADISDPVALSRHWLEIQKLRKKTKKKVDTKASKGRKIRYNVHKKLVNFMAPYDTHQWTEEAKNELFRSLFGKKEAQNKSEG